MALDYYLDSIARRRPSSQVAILTEAMRQRQAEENAMRRAQILQEMRAAEAREISGINHQNALAEMALRNRFTAEENAKRDAADLDRSLKVQDQIFKRTKEVEEFRDNRADERAKKEKRESLDKFFRTRGVSRNEGETDEAFEKRGFEEVRKGNRSQIAALDRGIDLLTRRAVELNAKAEGERQLAIERAARASLGITDQNAHIELKKPGMAGLLATEKAKMADEIRINPAAQREIALLQNEHNRLTEARRGLISRFADMGGSLDEMYLDPARQTDAQKGLGLVLPDEAPKMGMGNLRAAEAPRTIDAIVGRAPDATPAAIPVTRTKLNAPPPVTSLDEFRAFTRGLPHGNEAGRANDVFFETFADRFGLPDMTRAGVPYAGAVPGLFRGTLLKSRADIAREMIAQHPELAAQFSEFERGDATARESENFYNDLRRRLQALPY